jgi:hypothetical protein
MDAVDSSSNPSRKPGEGTEKAGIGASTCCARATPQPSRHSATAPAPLPLPPATMRLPKPAFHRRFIFGVPFIYLIFEPDQKGLARFAKTECQPPR